MELTKGNVTHALRVQEARDMADLEWWLPVGVDDRRSILQEGLLSGINKFLEYHVRTTTEMNIQDILTGVASMSHLVEFYLQENLGKDSVSFLLEQGREDDCDSVLLVLNVNGFSVTVVDGHQLRGRRVPVFFLLCQ